MSDGQATGLNTRRGRAVIPMGMIVGMVLLIALAVGAQRPVLVLLLLVAVACVLAAVRAALPSAPMLWVTVGICTPLYTAIYATALTTMFPTAPAAVTFVAYLLPLTAFVGALFWRRAAVGARLAPAGPGQPPRSLAPGLAWLALSVGVGIVTRAAMPRDADVGAQALGLVSAMAALSLLVAIFVADVALLLAETGRLFRTFTARMGRRVVPIFSFVVVFFFVVVVFAALYAVIDRFSGAVNFSVGGDARAINFAESLYFSFVTLSTIGYGDITPVSHLARLVVVGEVIFGVVLMLFAFAEIAAYDPEAEERNAERG